MTKPVRIETCYSDSDGDNSEELRLKKSCKT